MGDPQGGHDPDPSVEEKAVGVSCPGTTTNVEVEHESKPWLTLSRRRRHRLQVLRRAKGWWTPVSDGKSS